MDNLSLLESIQATAEYIRGMYEAYVNYGFTEEQAMELVMAHLQLAIAHLQVVLMPQER